MIIRRGTPDDAAILHEVAAETFPLACPPATTREAIDDFCGRHLSVASFESYLADVARDLFVAEADGFAVGYTMLVAGEPADPDVAAAISARPTVELSKCYVREGHHGAGIAAALVAASVERARQRGAAGVWLGVNEENARANRFYEKQGFVVVGVKKFLVGQRWEDDFVRELVVGEVGKN